MDILIRNFGRPVASLKPLSELPIDVVVGVDSSKSGTGIVIEDAFTEEIVAALEITIPPSVSHIQGSTITRRALSKLLTNMTVIGGSIEDVVTKELEGSARKVVNDYHGIRTVLTHIFDSYLIFFQDYKHCTLDIQNNNTWKTNVLPKGTNKRGIKGSLDYVRSLDIGLARLGDNITDAYCILQSFKMTRLTGANKPARKIKTSVEFTGDVDIKLVSPGYSQDFLSKAVSYPYEFNNTLTLMEHVNYIGYTLMINSVGYMDIPIDSLSYEDIYKLFEGKANKQEKCLTLVVRRLS